MTHIVNINPSISTITLNIIGFNTSIKRHRLSEWIQNIKPNCIFSIKQTNKQKPNHFNYENGDRLKEEGWRKVYNAKIYQNKAGIAILTPEIEDFKQGKLSGINRAIKYDKGVNSPKRHKSLMFCVINC